MKDRRGPIVLLSDFGLQDAYVGAMKGVLLGINPDAAIIDLCHSISAQNVRQGAALLSQNFKYFPRGSVFLAVVDPGVGTSRRAIAVKSPDYYFVGPDNGLLSFALRDQKSLNVRYLTNRKYWRSAAPSQTFHGRDIFAPVAAHISKRPSLFSFLGEKAKTIVNLEELTPVVTQKKVLGCIVYFDHFGNAMTNIQSRDLPGKLKVTRVGRRKILGLQSSYAQIKRQWIVMINSDEYLEIACPMSSAQKKGALKLGQRVVVQCE